MIAEIDVSKMEKGKKKCMIAEIGVSKMEKGKKKLYDSRNWYF